MTLFSGEFTRRSNLLWQSITVCAVDLLVLHAVIGLAFILNAYANLPRALAAIIP